MIIGFDGSRAFSNNKTGTENYSFQLIKALAKIDKKNKYIVYLNPYRLNPKSQIPNPKQSQSINYQNLKRFENLNLEFRNYEIKLISWPRLWTQAGLALQTSKDPLDVLFVPAHTLPLVRKPGLKTVVTVHDLGSEYLPSMHQLKQRLYLDLMQKFQLKTATKIIAVSKATKQDLINKIGLEEKKISVVHEGYDKELFQPCHSGKSRRDTSGILTEGILDPGTRQNDRLRDVLRQYDLKPKSYFLFVGTVQPRKNLERLIEAFAKLLDTGYKIEDRGYRINPTSDNLNPESYIQNPIYLVIAGSKGWLSDEIYKLPKKLGVEDKVKFLGYVPDQDLPALYSGALAFTFPSLFEGFGLPILEAQACGCPVLTSNLSSMPEVAGKGARYVNPYDIDDIVKGMGRCRIEDIRSRMIKAGWENIKRFSWEKAAREILEVLENLK